MRDRVALLLKCRRPSHQLLDDGEALVLAVALAIEAHEERPEAAKGKLGGHDLAGSLVRSEYAVT